MKINLKFLLRLQLQIENQDIFQNKINLLHLRQKVENFITSPTKNRKSRFSKTRENRKSYNVIIIQLMPWCSWFIGFSAFLLFKNHIIFAIFGYTFVLFHAKVCSEHLQKKSNLVKKI